MDCPKCGYASRVIDSRSESNRVMRRRKCLACEKLFFTTEVELEDSKENFNRLSREVYRQSCNRNFEKEKLKK